MAIWVSYARTRSSTWTSGDFICHQGNLQWAGYQNVMLPFAAAFFQIDIILLHKNKSIILFPLVHSFAAMIDRAILGILVKKRKIKRSKEGSAGPHYDFDILPSEINHLLDLSIILLGRGPHDPDYMYVYFDGAPFAPPRVISTNWVCFRHNAASISYSCVWLVSFIGPWKRKTAPTECQKRCASFPNCWMMCTHAHSQM